MKIPVNLIYEQNGVINAICTLDETVLAALKIIYPTKDRAIIEELKKRPDKDAYFFDSYCQFVIQFKYDHILGISLKLMDFQNSMDLALDEYLILKEIGWDKEHRDTIITLFSEIQKTKQEPAELFVSAPL